MDHQRIVGAQIPAHLAHGFHKRQRLDVTHRATYFGNDEIVFAAIAQQEDVALYFIGDVWHYLHSLAKVFALAFFGDHIIVNPAGGHVIGLRGWYVQKTLVMPQVEVGFCSIVSYITFPMFVWIERARIDIDVGIKFLDCNRKPSGLQQLAQRC